MSVGAPHDITDLAHAIVYNLGLDELLVRALASLLLDDQSVIVLCLSCSTCLVSSTNPTARRTLVRTRCAA